MSDKIKEYRSLIQKMFGKTSNVIIEDPENIEIEKFSTGSLKLDIDLKGGWAKGTLVCIAGASGSGKTTLCMSSVAEHQKKYPDEPVLWLDLEKVFEPGYFQNVGIDISPDKFILARPTVGEHAWDLIIEFAKSFKKGLVVIDSVDLMLPIKESEGEMEDANMALAARLNSKGLRKLFPYMQMGGVTVLAIRQIRDNIGGYGNPMSSSGGKAWFFYCRTNIISSVSKGESEEYSIHKYKQDKSNYGRKDRVTETTIEYGVGFNKFRDLLEIAVEQGVITKGGSWFSYGDTKLGQGVDNVSSLIEDNPELYEELMSKIDLTK